nr:glucomannan 4-beta-mannosyltransferase 2-like [Malus domestica]
MGFEIGAIWGSRYGKIKQKAFKYGAFCVWGQVYKVSIGAAWELSWSSNRLVIQVLDDSTDLTIKQMVELECQRWASEGINIRATCFDTMKKVEVSP